MTSKPAMRCLACGASKALAPVARQRRTVFRGVSLVLPDTLALTECDTCKELWLDDAEAEAYSTAVDIAYEAELCRRAIAAIDALSEVTTLRRLEELLHLSHGYLSKLRTESKAPSATLVGHLAILAAKPTARLAELERFWREPNKAAHT
jgi:hypothetical protein